MAQDKFTLPNSTQRIAIMGRTGSGKTQQAAWMLSNASIETRPWVVFDYKGDTLINSIPYAKDIDFSVPTKPGVFVTHPLPHEEDRVEKFLWDIWARGNVGVYVDEAFMMPKKGAYQALLTQGRSKHIPMINVTQKPRYVPMHVFSESDFYSVFRLNDKKDHQRVNEFMDVDLDVPLPKHCSHYMRVEDEAKFRLLPVPDADSIKEIFARRLAPKRRLL